MQPDKIGKFRSEFQQFTYRFFREITPAASKMAAICKSLFNKVMPYYGFEMDQIVSLHQLVSNAIVLTGSDQEKENAA